MSTNGGNGGSGKIPFDEKLCERYLFGELSEGEQERFESAYFSDDSFFNSFLAVKDEILDLYARNELDPVRRRRMEPHFLSTAPRRKRLAESKSFIDSVSLIADRSRGRFTVPAVAIEPESGGLLATFRRIITPLRFAAGFCLVLALSVGLWFSAKRDTSETTGDSQVKVPVPSGTNEDPEASTEVAASGSDAQRSLEPHVNSQPGSRPAAERDEVINADRSNDKTSQPIASPSAAPPAPQMVPRDPEMAVKETAKPNTSSTGPTIPETNKRPDEKPEVAGVRTATVTLDSATRSATKRNTVEIGSATQNVAVRLVFGGEAYPSYSVRISGVGGGPVWRGSKLKSTTNDGPKSITVNVDAGSLTRKDYIVVLEGHASDGSTETIREYYLRVDRQ